MELRVKGIDPARVRQARVEAGLNQEELAKLVGCSPRSIQNWESAGANESAWTPRSHHLRELAAATGKPISFFFAPDGVAA
jgi:transcriptional regulator with XRE-family HTH domain